MTSTLTLYFNSLLQTDKNFMLDKTGGVSAIETYLATLTSFQVTNYQYVKHSLQLTIKLDRNQSALMMGKNAKDLNYIKIQNGSENPMYYFITGKTWKASETIELSLYMDTLNSFVYNSDYLINKKTTIHRQHKDRMTPTSWTYRKDLGYITINSTGSYYSASFSVAGINSHQGLIVDKYLRTISGDDYSPSIYTLTINYETERATIVFPTGVPITHNCCVRVTYRVIKRDIDMYSEGINTPVYKTKQDNIIDREDNQAWYLLYRNTQEQDAQDYINTSPVECFLIPEFAQKVDYKSVSQGVIDTENTDSGKYYTIAKGYNELLSASSSATINLEINGSNYQPSYLYQQGWEALGEPSRIKYRLIVIYNNGGNSMNVYLYDWTITCSDEAMTNVVSSSMNLVQTITGATIRVVSDNVSVKAYKGDNAPTSSWSSLVSQKFVPTSNATISGGSTTSATLNGVNVVDRTDSKNIKLIALPYCPDNYSISSGVYTFSSNWSYDNTTGFMKLNDLSIKFNNNMRYNTINNVEPLKNTLVYGQAILVRDRDLNLESKLFHSDFYRPKFVYDSFSHIFQLEQYNYKIDFTGYDPNDEVKPNPIIKFIQTRTINSKFMFMFGLSVPVLGDFLEYTLEDYENILTISRNNEEVLFNSAYINYIRSGYNYDKKTLERTKTAGAVGLGLSITSALVTTFAGIATANPVLAGVGAVTTGVGIASQLTNLIKTTAQGEQAIQQKLDELSRQAVSVAGSDDVDLLDAYSDNKAKFVLYEVSSRMKKVLADLFYYCGYKADIQDLPNISSRYWFNYLQASLVITDSNNLTEEIEDDIKEKFENGVTILHYHNGYNFEQDKENWETSMVPYLGGN